MRRSIALTTTASSQSGRILAAGKRTQNSAQRRLPPRVTITLRRQCVPAGFPDPGRHRPFTGSKPRTLKREPNDTRTPKRLPVRPARSHGSGRRIINVAISALQTWMAGWGEVNLTGSLLLGAGEDRQILSPPNRPGRYPTAHRARSRRASTRTGCDFRPVGRLSSGDSDPYDDTEGGFHAIFENPVFAGADTSNCDAPDHPLCGGGARGCGERRNGILNSLRSSKEQGQSNFNNPGLMLLGAGADFDLDAGVSPVGQCQPPVVRKYPRRLQVLPTKARSRARSALTCRQRRSGGPRPPRISCSASPPATLVAGDGFRNLFDNLGPGAEILFHPRQPGADLLDADLWPSSVPSPCAAFCGAGAWHCPVRGRHHGGGQGETGQSATIRASSHPPRRSGNHWRK